VRDVNANLTVEEAREALIRCLENRAFEQKVKSFADGEAFLKGLRLNDSIQRLRTGPIKRSGAYASIGGWTLDLDGMGAAGKGRPTPRFHSSGIRLGSCSISLSGRFELTEQGEWRAVIGDGLTYAKVE